jgi:hypothetical protein
MTTNAQNQKPKRQKIHTMQLREVVDEINILLPKLNEIIEPEMQEDARNFNRYGVWYEVQKFEMVNGHPSNHVRCVIKCHTIPDATYTEILVEQRPEEDEEFDSFAHSYLCTLRAIEADFERERRKEELAEQGIFDK